MRLKPPTEHAEQQFLFEWAQWNTGRYPELNLLFAIPNGGLRSKATGAMLKTEGTQVGVPYLMLPVMRGGYGALFIEMKRVKGGRVQPEQNWWIEQLQKQGYAAVVCKGAAEAIDVIENYLCVTNK